MADLTSTRPPALASTADAVPYVPVSWMAVAAAFVAGLFVILLLFFGYSAAFKDKKPLIMPSLLILPAAGLVLSFAGRRMIRNSEGTRAGEKLTNAAWWASVVGGLGYAAYLSGIEYSIKSDAEAEVKRWMDDVVHGNHDAAFFQAMDVQSRSRHTRDNVGPLKMRFPERDVWFRTVDVVRVIKRNQPESCEFKSLGMRSWVSRPTMIECVFGGVLQCPEGRFPLEIGIRGIETAPGADGSVRQWEIVPAMSGFFTQKEVALTPYGWRILDLELAGGEFGREFVEAVRRGPAMIPWAYQTMVHPNPNLELWRGISIFAERDWWGDLQRRVLPILQEASRVPLWAVSITPDYQAHRWDKFFRRPGGEPATEEQEKQFLAAWNSSGVLPPGRNRGGLLPNNETIDAYTLVTVTDRAVEVRVPCELPEAGSGGQRAYRARVVVECTDRTLLDELNRLRAEAKPDGGTVLQPDWFGTRREKWRVVAVESDLVPIATTPAQQMEQVGEGPPSGGGR